MDDQIQSWADNLSPKQACKLIQIADPLTDEEERRFAEMSNDELLEELGVA